MNRADKALSGERVDLLETLAKHRYFLRYTVRDLTDEQAAQRTTGTSTPVTSPPGSFPGCPRD
jgi:hypothetical protein